MAATSTSSRNALAASAMGSELYREHKADVAGIGAGDLEASAT
jgi:hypothetical protein